MAFEDGDFLAREGDSQGYGYDSKVNNPGEAGQWSITLIRKLLF